MNAHKCHAEACEVKVHPRFLMCRKHWGMVPATIQRSVWNAYVPGQEVRKDPTPAYLEVMRLAIETVAVLEGRRGDVPPPAPEAA